MKKVGYKILRQIQYYNPPALFCPSYPRRIKRREKLNVALNEQF